jgi:carbon storage regulator
MLVLTRRPGEKVFISDDITVTVLEIRGNRIRIGIDAPKQVPIVREELFMEGQTFLSASPLGRQECLPHLEN